MRLFSSDRIAGVMDKLGFKEGEMIEHSMISKSIERAQKKVEELSNEAIALLHQFTGENAYLEQLLIQLIHRDR